MSDRRCVLDRPGPRQVAVVGLGLIGASCAAAIRSARPAWTVVGYDADAAVMDRARERGLVHTTAASRDEALRSAEIIVLATPVFAIVEIVRELPSVVTGDAVLIDVGSTKQMIVEAMSALPERIQAVGGHPMSGAVTAGTTEPTDRLFAGRAFVLCPTPSTHSETLAAVKQLVGDFKARVIEMTSADHDAAVALVSHLPHLLAFPLLQAFHRAPAATQSLAAGGFHSRVQDAGENIPMWFDILRSNRTAIAAAIGEYRQYLSEFETTVREGSERDLLDVLERAARR